MSIGQIVVDLLARTGSFNTDLDRSAKNAQKRAKEIDKAMNDAGKKIGAGLAVVGLAAGVMAKNAIDSLAELDDMAQKTGAAVEGLSKIQQTAVAFSQDMGEVDAAITKLAKGMVDTEDESNKTAHALAALGLSAKDASGNMRDPAELFTDIAKKLQQYQDGAQKAALMNDLFGKSGANLLPFMNDLAENVDKFTGASKEAAAEAARFQDQLGVMRVGISNLAQSIMGDALPSINALIEKMQVIQKTSITGWLFTRGDEEQNAGSRLKEIRGQLESISKLKAELDPSKGIANKLNDAVFGDFKDLERQESLLKKQKAYLEGVQQMQALTLGGADQNDRKMNPARSVLNYAPAGGKVKGGGSGRASTAASEFDRYLENLQRQLERTRDLTVAEQLLTDIQMGRLGKITSAQQDQLTGLAQQIDAAKAQEEAERKHLELVQEGQRVFDQTRTPLENLNAEYERLNRLLDAGVIEWDTYNRAVGAAQDEFDKLYDKVDKTKSEMDVFAENAAKNMQDAFADFFFDPFEGGLKGMVGSFEKAIRRMVAESLAADLTKGLFGSFSGGGGGGGTGLFGSLISAGIGFLGGNSIGGMAGDALGMSIGGTYGTATQSGLDDLIGSLAGRAGGGPIAAGAAVMTGESGRELFIPNTAGRILPAAQTAQVMNGGNNVTNMTFVLQSDNITKATQNQIAERAGRAVRLAQRRNG